MASRSSPPLSLLLLLLLALCGVALCADWPVLQSGSDGPNVVSLQHLLNAAGHSTGVDGDFGNGTETSVMNFQKTKTIATDGIVGKNTWTSLCPLLKVGSSGSAVRALQHQLNKHNEGISEDGVFGEGTRLAVISFQSSAGLSADGMAGENTWRELLGRFPSSAGMTVGEAVYASCSTTIVKGLSVQLVNTVNKCLVPGVLVDFSSVPNVSLGSAVFPYMQKNAEAAFRRAMNASTRRMTMNSAFRSLAQQLLLYQWYITKRCSIGLAAKPGTSNHETGLAFDCNDGSSWSSFMSGYSFKWFGNGDPPHFDYIGPSTEIRSSSTKAFQMLWNMNNPSDKIAVDGIYGPNTENRLLKSPANGFPKGLGC